MTLDAYRSLSRKLTQSPAIGESEMLKNATDTGYFVAKYLYRNPETEK